MIKFDNLTEEEMFIVRWQYRMLGSFETALIECIKMADDKNLLNLSCGFPIEVLGYMKYTQEKGWWNEVKKKALRIEEIKEKLDSLG